MAGPLEACTRPEGGQRNAPEHRERLDRRQAGLRQVRWQAQARHRGGCAASAGAVESEDIGKIAEIFEIGETVTKKCNKIVGKVQTPEPNLAKQQHYAAQNQKLPMKEIKCFASRRRRT